VFLVGETEPQDTRLLHHSGIYNDGLDALWNEDWHHSAFVALTGRREAYFTDYYGTAGEFASMARHNTLYQGQWYSWQKMNRGGYAIGLPTCTFVNFLENHDQIANTGLGWRLFHHVNHAKWRALTTLLLAGPAVPMLFQGEEFASKRPFTYFADHAGDLGESVREGRSEFLRQFPGLATPEMQSLVFPPNSRTAYDACKLNHARDNADHGWAITLHRDLLHLRREDTVLSRLGTDEITIETSAPTTDLVLIRYISSTDHRLLIINLGADVQCQMNDPLLASTPGHAWELLWSSEQPVYGGGGAIPFPHTGSWLIRGYSGTILSTVPGR
jgi:maltooligosyltrehalose trehalohydrolase